MPKPQIQTCTKPAGHPHGTAQNYDRGCRCEDSRLAKLEHDRQRRRNIAYGRHVQNKMVDSTESRKKILALVKEGYTPARIREGMNLDDKTFYSLLRGERDFIRRKTVEKINSFTPEPNDTLQRNHVLAFGATRRIRALTALGWSATELSKQGGTDPETGKYRISDTTIKNLRLGRAERIYYRYDDIVRELYERLWDTLPPMTTHQLRSGATRALGIARRHGWAPPMAWDDWGFDDPDYQPDTEAIREERHEATERVRNLVELLDMGMPLDEDTITRAGYNSRDSATRALHRAGYSTLQWGTPEATPDISARKSYA